MYKDDIAGFILSWRFECKQRRVNKKQWRLKIADKLRNEAKYKKGEWTTQDFCDTWDKLNEQKRIFI
jgi:hypothetical protein